MMLERNQGGGAPIAVHCAWGRGPYPVNVDVVVILALLADRGKEPAQTVKIQVGDADCYRFGPCTRLYSTSSQLHLPLHHICPALRPLPVASVHIAPSVATGANLESQTSTRSKYCAKSSHDIQNDPSCARHRAHQPHPRCAAVRARGAGGGEDLALVAVGGRVVLEGLLQLRRPAPAGVAVAVGALPLARAPRVPHLHELHVPCLQPRAGAVRLKAGPNPTMQETYNGDEQQQDLSACSGGTR